jgi:hypothetical protein
MKHSFSASFTKINRAKKHILELEGEISAFIASGPATFEATTTSIGFTVQTNILGVPEAIGAIVGDVIHNLRSALDLGACELVRAAGKNTKDVYFPFSETAEGLDGMIAKRNFGRAGESAVALLQSLKPYKNGNTALRVIHDLDVEDKHRALIPQVMCVASPVVRMWDDDGTCNPTVIGDPSAASEIKIMFPTDSASQGRELVPTLRDLVQLTHGVIEAFAALANRE